MTTRNPQEFVDYLLELGDLYQQKGDQFRSQTFSRAGLTLKSLLAQNQFPTEAKALRQIRGIGPSIQAAYQEWLQTGQITRLTDLRCEFSGTTEHGAALLPIVLPPTIVAETDREQVIKLFTGIYGVGPKTAERWYEAGLRTLEQVGRQPLTSAQTLGLIYYYHFQLKIPRSEMDLIRARLAHNLASYPNLRWEIAGSYRRGAAESGDVDCLIQALPNLALVDIVNLLKEDKFLIGDLALGPTKYMGIGRLSPAYNAHRIDLRWIEPESWAYALLYFTGSQKFNILMRQRALDLGVTLNEYGLTSLDPTNPVTYPAQTEAQIFAYLGVQYLLPEERNF